jgi:hypothetical protein
LTEIHRIPFDTDIAQAGYRRYLRKQMYNPQSNAFALMAMGKFLRTQGTPEYNGTIEINGKMFRFSILRFPVNSGELAEVLSQ